LGCWSKTRANAERFAARYGVVAYSDLDAMLGEAAVTTVFILSAADTHVEFAARALGAGKHVLVEKPVGETSAEIARLIDAAASAKAVCMPSHNYVYTPAVQRLRHHLKSGKLGRLQSFWMLCNQKQTQALGRPGMVMNEMMVHLAYASLFFCGRPKRLVSTASNVYFESGADDQIGVTLNYSDGVIANLWASWATHDVAREPWMCTIKAFGSEGSGVASWDNVKNHDLTQPGWDDSAYWDSFYYIQRYFFEEVLERGEPPLSTLGDALTSRAILDAATQSLQRSAWVEL